MSWVSLVLLRRISLDFETGSQCGYNMLLAADEPTSFRFLSALSWSKLPDRFSASLRRSSSSLAFFSSSVSGAISSVDSAKSTCPVFVAWNSA